MELKKLIKNTTFLVSTQFVQFLAGMFRAKINAIYLGTEGIGVFNQLNYITQQIAQFSMMSMGDATVKQIAENRSREDSVNLICTSLKTYIILVFFSMIVIIVLLFIFSNQLTRYVFGEVKYLNYYYLAIFTLPLLILNSIPFAILKGFKNVKAISRSRIGIIVVNLIVFVPLVVVYKLEGAVIFVPLSYLITLLFNYYVVRKNHLKELGIGLAQIVKAPFKRAFLREMFSFSGFGLVVMTYIIVSEIICRSIVITKLGIDQLGLYSPIIRWSGLLTGFLLPTFNTYLFPRYCETTSDKEISGILNDGIRLSTFYLIPFLFLGIAFRDILITLFYSREFISASVYLPYHFVGVAFYAWFYSLSMALTPTGRIKWNSFFIILFYSVNILIVYTLTNSIGLYAWMLKHIISPFMFFIVLLIFFRFSIGFKLSKSNIYLLCYAFLGTISIVVLDLLIKVHKEYIFIYTAIILLTTYTLLKQNERSYIRNKVLALYDKINKR